MSVVKPSENVARDIRPFCFSNMGQTFAKADVAVKEEHPDPGRKKTIEDERLVLSRRVTDMEQALRAADERAAADHAAAFEEGRRQGRAQAEKQDAERLALLRISLQRARENAIQALEAKQGLAVDIARATLGQILGRESSFTAMVTETARHWKAKLADAAVIRLRVSENDFPDESVLKELGADIGNLEVTADSELAPGACVFDLQLGTVDTSIPLQAARADAVLAGHGQATEAS